MRQADGKESLAALLAVRTPRAAHVRSHLEGERDLDDEREVLLRERELLALRDRERAILCSVWLACPQTRALGALLALRRDRSTSPPRQHSAPGAREDPAALKQGGARCWDRRKSAKSAHATTSVFGAEVKRTPS